MVQKLLDGFKKFRDKEYEGHKASMPRLVEEGQAPDYFIISCIDSRSNPGTIFRPAPGTFFAHKAMGAIVRPYKKGTALAAGLQFALDHNKVKKIVVLGHTGCGAIHALIDGIQDDEISSFLEVAQTGLQQAKDKCGDACQPEELQRHTEEEIVLESIKNLKGYPSVARALEDGRAEIAGWLFDMESGNVFEYNEKEDAFVAITDYK